MNDRMIGDRNDLGSPDAKLLNNMLASSSRYPGNEKFFQLEKMKVPTVHYSVELDIVRALLLKPGNLLEYMEEKISSQEDRVEHFSSVRV